MEDGTKPGKRYGHTLLFYKPYLILFGGNYNNEPMNDVWTFDSEVRPLKWTKLDLGPPDKCPSPRVYHSAGLCTSGSANGMMIIFGGRKKNGDQANDMWGLRRHRNGTWDWMLAPDKGMKPKDRIQHSSLVFGPFFINIGGRSQHLGDKIPIDIYDTQMGEWYYLETLRRFRHSCFIYDCDLYVHGGLEDKKKNSPSNLLIKINLEDLIQNSLHLNSDNNRVNFLLDSYHKYLQIRKEDLEKSKKKEKNHKNNLTNINNFDGINNYNYKEMILSDKAVIYTGGAKCDDFEENSKTVSINNITSNKKDKNNNNNKNEKLHEKFIKELLKPKDWINVDSSNEIDVPIFDFAPEDVLNLIQEGINIVSKQPTVLKVEAPVKVFGDIHGQYSDLMRFFDLYSAPISGPGGDIEGLDYIFLGDYVDRGNYSLETICLLIALKIKYPNQIHLLRGNHEDRWINSNFGFQKECIDRMNDNPENSVIFNKFNDFFDFLPLAAIVDDTVLCIHGGIGSSIASISDIEKIQRPLEVIHEVSCIAQQLVVDILWSDPTDSDSELGIQPNSTRDPNSVGNIVKFGPDRVEAFLKNNNLSLILRAHECVLDGFERFASGKLITVFSATDYCGKHKNAGAILFLTKNYAIKPYLIYPQDSASGHWQKDDARPVTPPRTRDRGGNNFRKSY